MAIQTLALLTVALGSGVETGWVQVDGQQTYEIRIEPQLLERISGGDRAIAADVDSKGRELHRFQIRADLETSSWCQLDAENVGWKLNNDGHIDYWVQLSPEQLHLLQSGTSFVGEVLPQAEKLNRVFVFVGTQKLPRESQLTHPSALATPSVVPEVQSKVTHLEAAGFTSEARTLRARANAEVIGAEVARAKTIVSKLSEVLQQLAMDDESSEVESLRQRLDALLDNLQTVTDKLGNNGLLLKANGPLNDSEIE